jgi:hypothetical protein
MNYLWAIHFANDSSNFTIESRDSSRHMWADTSIDNTLILHWDLVPTTPSSINVTLNITLPPSSQLSHWVLGAVNNDPAAHIAIWDYNFQVHHYFVSFLVRFRRIIRFPASVARPMTLRSFLWATARPSRTPTSPSTVFASIHD